MKKRTAGIVLLILLLLLWEASARFGWVKSENWPTLVAVLEVTYRQLLSGELSLVLAASMARMIVGFVIGSLCGILLGLLLGTLRTLDGFLTPLVEAVRPIPVPAIIPPLILFLGIDDALKIFVVAFSVFFPMLVSTVGGVRNVDETLIRTARTLQTTQGSILRFVILPAALPSIMSGFRISLPLALITTVVAEMIAGSSGIGYVIVRAQYAMQPQEMYSAVLCLMVIGYLLNLLFLLFERRLIPWYHLSENA
ncbi:MAG: ABC transporter permease subunit [Rhizobiales bacterium]|nr:ABC transporter permease subunit [Hyphomicrobiales bacterium]